MILTFSLYFCQNTTKELQECGATSDAERRSGDARNAVYQGLSDATPAIESVSKFGARTNCTTAPGF